MTKIATTADTHAGESHCSLPGTGTTTGHSQHFYCPPGKLSQPHSRHYTCINGNSYRVDAYFLVAAV